MTREILPSSGQVSRLESSPLAIRAAEPPTVRVALTGIPDAVKVNPLRVVTITVSASFDGGATWQLAAQAIGASGNFRVRGGTAIIEPELFLQHPRLRGALVKTEARIQGVDGRGRPVDDAAARAAFSVDTQVGELPMSADGAVHHSIAFVQKAFIESASASSLTIGALTTTAGNTLIAGAVSLFTSVTDPITSFMDSKANAWTKDVSLFGSGKDSAALGHAPIVTGGASHTATVTFNGTKSYCGFCVAEYSGIDPVSSCEATNSSGGTSANGSPGAVNPASANSVYIGLMTTENLNPTPPGGGWTERQHSFANSDFSLVELLGSGSQQPTWTFASQPWGACVATYKPVAAAGKLFRPNNLSGLGSGGPFFSDPLGV